mgnify:CR=1 FL=1
MALPQALLLLVLLLRWGSIKSVASMVACRAESCVLCQARHLEPWSSTDLGRNSNGPIGQRDSVFAAQDCDIPVIVLNQMTTLRTASS